MDTPPVLTGLAHVIPPLLVKPIILFLFLRLVQQWTQYPIHTGIVFLACLLSNPIFSTASNLYRRRRHIRNAYLQGARMGPQVNQGRMSAVRTIVGSQYPAGALGGWAEEYGNTYRLGVMGDDFIFTTEPEHIKAILTTQFSTFVKGKSTFVTFLPLLGRGVFNSDGDLWKFHRTMTRPFFTKDRISDFENFEKHADDAISQIKTRLFEGYPVEFQDVVARFTLDSATEFLFGKDVESLGAGLPYPENSDRKNPTSFRGHPSNVFVEAFVSGQNLVATRTRTGLMWWLFSPFKDKVKEQRRIINNYVEPIISEVLSRRVPSEGEKNAEEKSSDIREGETFLDHLAKYTDDYKTLQDQLINMLVAGRDTTASLLTFAVYMMIAHPDVAAKLRQEIAANVGPSRAPTPQDLHGLKYLKAFLNETLRLYPSVPVNSRSSTADVTLPSGNSHLQPIYVPANTRCLYSVFLMHRRKDLWGPDAWEFDPNRFIDERLQKYLVPNPFIFLPFNAGPRICLGQQFAYNEASFFLVRLLQSFSEFRLDTDAQPDSSFAPEEWKNSVGTQATEKLKLAHGLTMSIKDGLWVRMKEESMQI